MNVTVIKINGTITKIFTGDISKALQDWVDQINSNPLVEDCELEEVYTNKTVYEMVEFLGLNNY